MGWNIPQHHSRSAGASRLTSMGMLFAGRIARDEGCLPGPSTRVRAEGWICCESCPSTRVIGCTLAQGICDANGAGGNRTPVPNGRSAASTCVVDGLVLGSSDGHRQPAESPSREFSHPDVTRSNIRASPLIFSPYRPQTFRYRPATYLGCKSILRIGSYKCARLITRFTCAATRHDSPVTPGRIQIGPG